MGLSAYSMIRMEDGTEKRAEDVAAGDRVRDPVSGAAAAVARVLNGPGVGMVGITAANGDVLHLTGDHAVLTAQGPLAAARLAAGMQLRAAAGPMACVEVVQIMGDYNVYDIEVGGVAGSFSISANGIAVAAAVR